MTGYHPSSPAILAEVAVLLAATIGCGLALTRRRLAGGRLAAWVLLVAGAVVAERLTREEPAGLRMLAICGALFFGMKGVVGVADREERGSALPVTLWLGFAVGWPGMWPSAFARRSEAVRAGSGRLVREGLLRLAEGAVLVGASRLVWVRGSPWVATVLLLTGLSLILHFGLFTVAAGVWRMAGFSCRPLFRAPLVSTSLSEFWGRRWNLAFTEMIQLSIYRPLAAALGRKGAAFAAFLFSGLLHELAITVPTRSGYGRPLLYFTLQGGFVLLEQAFLARGRPVDRHRAMGRAWTLAALALPLPLLVPLPFVRQVLWPIIE